MNAMQRHLADIESGNVTKTNVIGLRKALNHVTRLARGWSGNRCAATADEVRAALDALERHKPLVRGDLHASGVRLLTDKRYRKRLEPVADKVAALHGFRLVGYQETADCQHAAIFEAVGTAGAFRFYSIPWQTALYSDLDGGPHILTECGA
jgi:hypothetical protein